MNQQRIKSIYLAMLIREHPTLKINNEAEKYIFSINYLTPRFKLVIPVSYALNKRITSTEQNEINI